MRCFACNGRGFHTWIVGLHCDWCGECGGTGWIGALATETRRAETTGSVEDEGAGPKDNAQKEAP